MTFLLPRFFTSACVFLGVVMTGASQVAAAPVPPAQVFVGEPNPDRVPALLQEQDLFPAFGGGKSFSRKASLKALSRSQHSGAYIFSKDLTKHIVGSYMFLGDFSERQRPTTPANWISPQKDMLYSLTLGDAHSFERPKVDIVLPVYRMLFVPFFKGKSQKEEDFTTFRLNTAMNFWRVGNIAKAQELFDEMAKSAVENEVPYDDPAVIAAWAARGFFYLEILAKQRKASDVTPADLPQEVPTPKPTATPEGEKKEGEALTALLAPSAEELAARRAEQEKKLKEFRESVDLEYKGVASRARDSFARVFYKSSVEKVFGKLTRVNKQLFERTFDCPLFMEPRGGISVQCSRTPLANSFDPMDWVRASAVSILWNTAVMQRVIGDWTGVFDNGDALAGLVKRLDSEFLASVAWKNENGQVMVPAPLVTTSAPYGIWPRNEKDMLAAMHFLRAFGFEKARDPQEILRSVDQGIRMAASPELAALGFLYAGNVYFDLHSFALARRTYAWCESVAESFSEKVPGCLLFGAEAAFWESNFGAAARGFEKFIKHAADKEYVPWAYFRLALIAHQKGRRVEAEQRYAEIMRLYAAHATALESTVRNACLQIASNDFSYEGKRKIAAELQSAVSLSRQDLKRQAETCALRVLLENASDDARNRSNLPDDAKVQLALLEKYEKDFPGSPFLPLFEQRAKDIKHAFVVNLVDNNECEALQAKYEAQSKELDSLGSKAKVFLPALEWGDSERKIVIRCAALSKNLKLWAKLGKTNIGQDGGVVQKRLYDFYNTKQSSRAAVSLAKSIDSVADMEQWVKASREVTAAGRGYVRSSDFWLGLSLGALLRFDVSKPSSQTRELRQVLLRGIQKAPASLWGNDILCSMAMPELSRFSVAFWDDLAKSKKTAEWLELLKKGTSVPKDNKERCLMQVSKALWASTGTKPSQFRDSHIVLPYLEERGFAEVSDEWLAYAQRLEKREGPTKNVRLVYERLSKEGSSDTIRKMTQLWLENHPKEY